MQFERGKPPETPNAPYRAARIKGERWRSAGPGFEPGRAGPRLSLTSSQDDVPYMYAVVLFNAPFRAYSALYKKLLHCGRSCSISVQNWRVDVQKNVTSILVDNPIRHYIGRYVDRYRYIYIGFLTSLSLMHGMAHGDVMDSVGRVDPRK
jgi:hypothetical protein